MVKNKIGISDLVEISEKPEAFIVLTRAVNENPEDTLGTYVVTDDIREHVSSILSQIHTGKGKGFCVQGFPGSGKSHFLSFITLLLKEKEAWNHPSEDVKQLKREFYDKLKDKNFLTIYFSLTEGGDLKVSLYEEAEKQGAKIVQANAIYENFFIERTKSINWDDFYRFVKEKEGLSKEEVDRLASQQDKTSIAEITIKYDQSRGVSHTQRHFREILYPPILEGVDGILEYAKEKGMDGVIAVIDELSQYLKERHDRGKMQIDISLLRSLEDVFRAGKPFWVIAAAHEDIGRLMGYALDRFETIIQSKIDIRHILARRIAKKKPGNEGYISDLYHEFSLLFPKFSESVTLDEFRDLYPFHKAFVENAVLLAEEASRMRSIVLICWDCLAKVKKTEEERPEEKDAHNLITINVLYDQFLLDPRIREKYNRYFNVYEEFFKPDIIPKLERNRKLAHKLIKSLIVLAITGKDRVTVKDLTHMLLEKLFKLEKTDVNYQGVKDTLDELKRLSLDKYLSIAPVSRDPLESTYYIDVKKVGITLEEEIQVEMNELRGKGDDALKPALKNILNSREPLFYNIPIEEMEVTLAREVTWNNTPRKGKIKLALPKDVRTLPQLDPTKDDIDFSFIVSMPFYTTQEEDIQTSQELLRKINDPRIFFWLPKEMTGEEKEKLRRYRVIHILQERYKEPKTTEEREKAAELPVKLSQIQGEVESRIEWLYRGNAIICNASGRLPLRPADYIDAAQIIEKSIEDALNLYYTEHPEYRATISRSQTNKLIKSFVKEGKAEHRTNEIINYAEPLGIVGPQLELDAERSKYVKVLLKNVPEEESVNIETLFRVLRGEKYGIQDFSFEVLLAAMIKQGLITGYMREGEIFAPEELANVGSGSKALINVLQTVEKGKMINFPEPWASVVKILNTLYPEVRTTPYSTATQHTMWETAKKRIGEEKDRLDLTKQELGKLLESTGNQETTDLLDPIETLLRVYDGINPNLDPKKGLEVLHEGVLKEYPDLDSFKQSFNQVEQLKDFCGKRRDNTLIDSYNYLKALIEGYEGLKNIENLKRYLDTPLLTDLWRKFIQLKSLIYDTDTYKNFTKDYERFTESYAKAYAGSHTEYYTRRNTFNARLNQIKESKEYNALELLSGIKKVRPYPSFEEVRKRLDQQLATCEVKGLYGLIRGSPFCECGYKIGLEEKIPTTEETEQTIIQSLLSQVKMLQQKATKNRILTYANEEAIPILRKQKIQSLLRIGPSPENVEQICSLVSQEAVETISNALKDAVHIPGKEIINELAGSYSLQEIARATQEKITTLAERKIREEGKSVKDKDILIVITGEG
ncbi:MAG: hypothetical protein E3J73_05310 [Candidatus Bathyarchaeum sp.]|nr:MAG: hypothetical protein E3J73_05310 [Candidatus Bathyarchaeum sp.]